MAWRVPDIHAAVADLRSRGVRIEDYTAPDPVTVDGIADMGHSWAAWFIDPQPQRARGGSAQGLTSRRARRQGLDIGVAPRCSVAPWQRHPRPGSWSSPTSRVHRLPVGSELEHAPVIAGDLLETIVGRLDPPFRLAKFEGDAGFLFVEDGRADGSLLVDAIEACYLAFRRRLRSIDAATTCDCDSCRLAPAWTSRCSSTTGPTSTPDRRPRRARGLGCHPRPSAAEGRRRRDARTGTASPVHRRGRRRSRARSRRPGDATAEESIEHLGRVTTFVWDLEARWQAETGRAASTGREGDVVLDVDAVFPAEPSDVWAHLTVTRASDAVGGSARHRGVVVGGRRGVGTITQCVTGRLATIEEVVDWQPYDHSAGG